MQLHFENAQFDYRPYPICYIPNFIDEPTYKTLCDQYPSANLFSHKSKVGGKYSLAEVNNPDFYFDFLQQSPAWRAFYNHVKSADFIQNVLFFLKDHHVDLGIKQKLWFINEGKNITKYTRALAALRKRKIVTSKFEFSAMPANGGNIMPHTDSMNKIITLVLSFVHPGEWDHAWGGGTSVVMPKDETRTFNQINEVFPFDAVDTLKTFPLNPNQCLLFIKTFNSWHSVAPMKGPQDVIRKTVTINIKTVS